MDCLSIKNKHSRDKNIKFDEGNHIYTIDEPNYKPGKYISVTTFVHSHFDTFDSDKIIDNMMKGKNWINSQYYGKTKDEIKKMWDKKRVSASGDGTKLHRRIEDYYNSNQSDINADINSDNDTGFRYFLNFVSCNPTLNPYRTEWTVYHEDIGMAGTIDMVYENPDGTLSIYDWKRAKDISKNNKFNKYALTECIGSIPDTKYWHYALQLNIYKSILERKYDKTVTKLALVVLHPDGTNFEIINLPIMETEINDLFDMRKSKYDKY